jgi:hypothetical protein
MTILFELYGENSEVTIVNKNIYIYNCYLKRINKLKILKKMSIN